MEVFRKGLEQCLAIALATVQQLLLRQGCPLMVSQLTMFSLGRNAIQAMIRSAALLAYMHHLHCLLAPCSAANDTFIK